MSQNQNKELFLCIIALIIFAGVFPIHILSKKYSFGETYPDFVYGTQQLHRFVSLYDPVLNFSNDERVAVFLPLATYFQVLNTFSSPYVNIAFLYWILFSIGGVTYFLFLRTIINHLTEENALHRAFCFLATLFYMYNPHTIIRINSITIIYLIPYFLLPTLFIILQHLLSSQESCIKHAYVTSIVLTLMLTSELPDFIIALLPFLLTILIYVSVIGRLDSRKLLKYFALAIFFTILLNSWRIYAYYRGFETIVTQHFVAASGDSLEILGSQSTPLRVLALLGFWHIYYYDFPVSRYYLHLNTWSIYKLLTSIFPAFLMGVYCLSILSLRKGRNETKAVLIKAVLIMPIFTFILALPLSVGIIHFGLVSRILKWVYNLNPVLLAFRANHRFLSLLAFVYPIIFTIVASLTVAQHSKVKKLKLFIVVAFFVSLLIFNIIPIIFDLPVQKEHRIMNIPSTYMTVADIMKKDRGIFATLILTPSTHVENYAFGNPRTNLWRALISNARIIDAFNEPSLRDVIEGKSKIAYFLSSFLSARPYIKYLIVDNNYDVKPINTHEVGKIRGIHLIDIKDNIALFYNMNYSSPIFGKFHDEKVQPITAYFSQPWIIHIFFNRPVQWIEKQYLYDSSNWKVTHMSIIDGHAAVTLLYMPQLLFFILLLTSFITLIITPIILLMLCCMRRSKLVMAEKPAF